MEEEMDIYEPEVMLTDRKRASGALMSSSDSGIVHESEYARRTLEIFEKKGLGPEGLADVLCDEIDRLNSMYNSGKNVSSHMRAVVKLAAELSGHLAHVSEKKKEPSTGGTHYHFNAFAVTESKPKIEW